jgi:hypothetical protein
MRDARKHSASEVARKTVQSEVAARKSSLLTDCRRQRPVRCGPKLKKLDSHPPKTGKDAAKNHDYILL